MALVRVRLPDALPPAPPEVVAFIADAQARIDAFINSHVDAPVNSFVPSDFSLAYGALRHVADRSLATGTRFCEWGSGAGVVTCLAAMAGFSACGIEFEPELIELSARLASDHGVNVEFYHGNLVPTSGQQLAEQVEEFEWLAVGGPDAYSEMGLDVDDFDVVFAYPWPGEHRVIERIFDRFSADGALLMTYDGVEGVRLHRRRSTRAAR